MKRLREWASLWAYQQLMRVLILPLLVKLWWRGRREPQYRHAMTQRLGIFSGKQQAARGLIWLHAVSLGETRAAAALVHGLRQAYPDRRFLLTHSTATGWMAGQALLQDGDTQVWAPWDTPGAVKRFLTRFSPSLGLVMETEVWPSWMQGAAALSIPMVLVNARLSERSAQKVSRWPALMRPAYAAFQKVLAQSQSDAGRLKACGAVDVSVVGNLKYDMPLHPTLVDQGRAWRRQLDCPVVVLASSRDGEERMWIEAMARLRAMPDLQWLIVPRHPQRWAEVKTLLEQHGWQVVSRSTWSALGPPQAVISTTAKPTVWLGDSMGEMPLYFAMAQVALLGGSFAPFGGQNLIEALVCGCPVITGPNMHNFEQVLEDLRGDAVAQAAEMSQALTLATQWLEDTEHLRARAQRGRALVGMHAGATEAIIRNLVPMMGWVGENHAVH